MALAVPRRPHTRLSKMAMSYGEKREKGKERGRREEEVVALATWQSQSERGSELERASEQSQMVFDWSKFKWRKRKKEKRKRKGKREMIR